MNVNPDLSNYKESTEHNLICVGNFFGGLVSYSCSGCVIHKTESGAGVAYEFDNGKIFIHKELSHIGLKINNQQSKGIEDADNRRLQNQPRDCCSLGSV